MRSVGVTASLAAVQQQLAEELIRVLAQPAQPAATE